MSEYYYIMAEAKLNGTWYNIDPWIKKMNGEFEHQYLGWRSRSFTGIVGEACHGSGNNFNYLAPTTQAIIKDGYRCEYGQEDISDWSEHERVYLIEDIAHLRKQSNTYDYEGFVSRNAIKRYENNDDEIGEVLSGKEYAALPSDVRENHYTFYQWNDPYEAKDFAREVLRKADEQLYMFNDTIDWKTQEQLRKDGLDAEATVMRLVVRIL